VRRPCSCGRRPSRCRKSTTRCPRASCRSTRGPWRGCPPGSRPVCAPRASASPSFPRWRGCRRARWPRAARGCRPRPPRGRGTSPSRRWRVGTRRPRPRCLPWQPPLDDAGKRHVAALAVGDVGREDEPRAARRDPVAERARAEAREDDGVDRADADGREHEHDCLRRGRHVDREAVAAADPERAQGRRRPLHLREQLGVRQAAPVAALVRKDERRLPAPARLDVAVEAVPGEVRLRAGEPAEARAVALEDALPGAKSGQLARRLRPEVLPGAKS
jgi:hypothetical protein